MSKIARIASVIFSAAAIVAVGLGTGGLGIAFGLAALGSGLLGGVRIGDIPKLTGGFNTVNAVSTNKRLPVVYGTTQVAPQFVDIRSGSIDSDVLYVVGSLSHGPIQNIGDIKFDGQIAISGSVPVNPFTTSSLQHSTHVGTFSQTLDTILATDLPNVYGVNFKGNGIAYIVFKLTKDDEGNVFPNGIPQPITAHIQGRVVFDPRDSQTKFSDNPALCIRDYLTNIIYGYGIPDADINDTSFSAMANFCDEVVSTPSGDTKRYTCNGIVDTDRSLGDNLNGLLTSCLGILIYQEGKYRLHIPRPVLSTGIHINELNTVGDWNIQTIGADNTFNTFEGVYISPQMNYQPDTVNMPTGSTNPFLTLDNGMELSGQVQLPFTDNVHMAQRITGTVLKRSRERSLVGVTCHEDMLAVQVGDVVEVSNDSAGWSQKQFEVISWNASEAKEVGLSLLSYDVNDYVNVQEPNASVFNTNLPNPFDVRPPTNVQLFSGVDLDRMEVTWTKQGGVETDRFEVGGRKISGSFDDFQWRTFSTAGSTERRAFITGVRHNDLWQARVRTRNRLNIASNWVTSSVVPAITHAFPQASFGTPQALANGVLYPVTFLSASAYVDVWTRQGNSSVADPLEIPQMYAGRMLPIDESFEIGIVGANTNVKTKLVAFNSFNERGDESGITNTAVLAGGTIPGKITNLITTNITSTSVSLQWTNADGISSIQLFLNGALAITLAPGTTVHTFTGLTPNTWNIVSARHLLNGTPSNPENAFIQFNTTVGSLGAPQNVSVSSGGPDQTGQNRANVVINWDIGINGGNANYSIFRELQLIGTSPQGVLTFQHFDDANNLNSFNFTVVAKASGFADSSPSVAANGFYARPNSTELQP